MYKLIRKTRVCIFGALATGLIISSGVSAQETEVGTPRNETLIVDMLAGTLTSPEQMNPHLPGAILTAGLNQLIYSALWDINTSTGEMEPILAAEMPEALNDDFTKYKVVLREGITWSDGEPFTSEDLVFTADMLRENDTLVAHGMIVDNLADIEIIDEHTLEFTLTKPTPRFATLFGSDIFGPQFRIVPEHIWSDVDPTTFNNFPPVTTGPYVYKDHDPNGNWLLWEKRSDWQDSDLAAFSGEPKPGFVFFRYYGPEERRVLAMAQDDLDVLMDISPDGWQALQNRNDNVKAWFDSFPYANMDDPCERGIHFNTTRAPYDKAEVRWALALATGIEDVSLNTFNGMLRVSPLQAPPIQILMETYHIPMTDWLTDFALPDGYKPFNPSVAESIVEQLKFDGVEGLPETTEELKALFGVGWWKKDYEQATKMLEGVGFSKDDDGKWMLPDGSPWTILINAPADFEVLSQRLAFAVANEWQAFGINAEVRQMQGGPFWTNYSNGDFDLGSYWWPSSCAVAPDLFHNLETWHEKYVVAEGENSGNNRERFSTPEISALIDKVTSLPADDPQVVAIWTEVLQELVKGMPVIDMVGTSKFVPVNETYWTNFASAENYYEGPWWWWTQFKMMMAEIEPVEQ
ncbi:ABC transporter substrate-binding protein [bacterium]|nr:ABC transporter substrate-binding protein [bacterium]